MQEYRTMNKANVDLLIMIKGEKPAFEYQSPLDFKTYVEGRDGSEFEIEVRNRNTFRIEAVISVDGLSVLDGKTAGDDTQGYLVPALGSVRIPGWKLNGTKAAAFVFSGRKGGSYVEQSTGQATNKGVIGMMVFEEKAKMYRPDNNVAFRGLSPLNIGTYYSGNAASGVAQSGLAMNNASFTTTTLGNAATSASAAATSSVSAQMSAKSASINASSVNVVDGAINGDRIKAGMIDADRIQSKSILTVPVEQTLGTGFGKETDFATKNVAFDRGEMIALIAIYYDDKRGLTKRGIEMVRPSQTRYATSPNPFPNREDAGCEPPKGWTGK
jgi:hypothetical protein